MDKDEGEDRALAAALAKLTAHHEQMAAATKRAPGELDAAKLSVDVKRFIIAYSKFTERLIDTGSKTDDTDDSKYFLTYTRAHKNTVLLIAYLRRVARA